MALQKKTSELPLIGGLDTKTDDKQVKLGKLLSAQNLVYQKPGKINKREGFTGKSQTIIDNPGSSIQDGQAIMKFRDELITFDKNNVYSWVEGSNGWKDKGDFQSAYMTSTAVSNGSARDYSNDNAYHPNGLECYVFQRESAGSTILYYQVTDSNTKQIIVGPTPIGTGLISPRVITFGDQFVIYYYNTGDTRLYRGLLSITNVTATITFDFVTQVAGNDQTIDPTRPIYDVATIATSTGTYVYLCFNAITLPISGRVTINRYDNPSTLVPSATNVTSVRMKFAQIVYIQAREGIGIFFSRPSGNTNEVCFSLWNTALTASNFYFTTTPTGTVVNRISATSISATTGLFSSLNLRVFADWSDPATGRQYIGCWSRSNTTWTQLFSTQQLAIAGGAFTYAGKGYVIAIGGADITDPSTLATYFTLDENGEVISRFGVDIAGGINKEYFSPTLDILWVPKSIQTSTTEYFTSLRTITTFGDVSGVQQTGITYYKTDFFEPERSYSNAEIAKSLYVGGGMLFQYDGQNLVEDGFNWAPKINNITALPAGGTNNYQYVAVWEWVDNAGNLHRSAPSAPYTITTTSPIGAGGNGTNIEIFPLALTDKTLLNNRSPVVCVLYRTKVNLGVFYKLPITAANTNDTNALWIEPANDLTPDADLTETLYTTDNVLDNTNAPPVGAMAVYRNRLFVLDSTNPLVIYYSKIVNFAQTVEFSDGQIINVDPSGGDVTGLAAMDDKLLIFKKNSIRYISGQGPDPTGANDDFQGTILITTDAGCTNSRSIVSTPEGVIFKSSKGIYFINRGLQVSYIGAAVEKWNDDFITSGVLMTENNQVRLTLDSGTVLVYDYYVDNWATFTNLYAVDSVVWNDKHAFIKDTGRVMVETANTYTDDGVSYPMQLTTGWMSFGGIQGFQRLWKINLLGAFKTEHKLQVNLYYDYNDAYSQTIVVDPETPSVYGTGLYGDETPYGGTFQLYQYELRPSRQKCMSVKVSIQDVIGDTAPLEEAYELSNIRLSYGVIGGSNRLRNAQVFG